MCEEDVLAIYIYIYIYILSCFKRIFLACLFARVAAGFVRVKGRQGVLYLVLSHDVSVSATVTALSREFFTLPVAGTVPVPVMCCRRR
jgi:hypothetical protein